jgi:hypothetical protein
LAEYPAARRRDPPDPWIAYHFSQANPKGAGQADVSALLRRVADSIDALGEVDVQDLMMHTEVTADGDWHSITVYYQRAGDDRGAEPTD